MAHLTDPLRQLAQPAGNPTGKPESLRLVEESMERLQPRDSDPIVHVHGLPLGGVADLEVTGGDTEGSFKKRLRL